ncbi:MAG: cellulase family glycosylhydrolase [Parafilimonas sp.]|nr:cellulase family glycosylhydrolase [Parafilimonas sp.]
MQLQRIVYTGFIALLTICDCCFSQTSAKNFQAWWNEPPVPQSKTYPKAKQLSLIKVSGNKFINANGDSVLFRGVSIADPDKIEHEGHWNKHLFEQVKNIGTMLVRIPVHPVSWRERTASDYLILLDSAVSWCTDLNLYVDIDWHSIGNLEMELFQDPMYNTTKKETYEFWRTISKHFADNNTVAFYELFNEPTTYHGQLGTVSWKNWKEMNENIIHLIRSYDAETIELVAGFDWAYDLTPLREEPINAANIAYVTHPYPFKRSQPWESKWEEDFGFAAQQYPVIATEIGFEINKNDPADGAEHYGQRITTYLEKNGISWVAWVYDPKWWPQMIKSWNFDLTATGDFFKTAMQKK